MARSTPRLRLKIYIEEAFGGTLIPLEVRLFPRHLIIEVAKDSHGPGEEAAQKTLQRIMALLKETNVSFSCDTDPNPKGSPHRVSIAFLPTSTR